MLGRRMRTSLRDDPIDEAALEKACIRVLQQVDRGQRCSTHPQGEGHHAWECTLIAVGWMYMDMERAVVELESILKLQQEDGRILCGPGSPTTAVPFIASVIRMVYHSARLRQRFLEPRLAGLVPQVNRFHRWCRGRDHQRLYPTVAGDRRVVGLPADGERFLRGRPERRLAACRIH